MKQGTGRKKHVDFFPFGIPEIQNQHSQVIYSVLLFYILKILKPFFPYTVFL